MNSIPDWLGTAIIGAVIGLLAYVGKTIHESFRKFNERKEQKYAALVGLNSLLNASRDVFRKQVEIRNDLYQAISERLKENILPGMGYESFFATHYSEFNEDEQELHTVMRGYSIALFELNSSMLLWLKIDHSFKTTQEKTGVGLNLAQQLNLLESHLYLWIAKYNAGIPNNLKHALVYLADEKYQGDSVPFRC